MPIGSSGVSDYANTSSGLSSGVVALYGIGGAGVVDRGEALVANYIATEAGDLLDTESGDNLITEQ